MPQDALAKGLKDKVPKAVAAAAGTLVKVVECVFQSYHHSLRITAAPAPNIDVSHLDRRVSMLQPV